MKVTHPGQSHGTWMYLGKDRVDDVLRPRPKPSQLVPKDLGCLLQVGSGHCFLVVDLDKIEAIDMSGKVMMPELSDETNIGT